MILLDEVGKMELLSRDFVQLASQLFLSDSVPVIFTVPEKCGHQLVNDIKNSSRVKLVVVTKQNRDSIYDTLIKPYLESLTLLV